MIALRPLIARVPYRWQDAPVEARALANFYRHFRVEPTTGCWLWTGATARARDGVLRPKMHMGDAATKLTVAPSRFVLSICDGIPLADRYALEACHRHHCTSVLCVNPQHLYWGTRAQNEHDKRQRALTVSPTVPAPGRAVPHSGSVADDPTGATTTEE